MSEQRLRDRIEELERAFGLRDKYPRPWRLSLMEGQVFAILLKRQVATHEQLYEAVWGGGQERCAHIVKVTVCKLRKKLCPLGIDVRNEWNTGYFIPPESKRLARALMAAYEQERAA